MYFTHTADIWRDFPHLQAGCLFLRGIHTNVDASATINELQQKALQTLASNEMSEIPQIKAWRGAYSSMGLKPTQYRCAAESLLRRLKKDGSFPSFHPLVDLCNALSMAYATPIAVIDADKFTTGITVGYAEGDEQYLDFGDAVEAPEQGEVIFEDEAEHAHSRRWCFRQSKASVITPSTENALIVCESQHEHGLQDMQQLHGHLTSLLTEYWGAPESSVLLSTEDSVFEFASS